VRRYELTDRGKFYIAVLLIAILIVVLIITLASWSSSRETAPIDSIGGPDSLIQNGEDLPSNKPILDADPDVEPDLLENNDPDQSLIDPDSLDLDAGTMSFHYTLDMQTYLDDNVVYLIGELLTSPKNTEASLISVEIPQLSDDDTIILTSAIIDVLSGFDVPLSDIVFFVVSTEIGVDDGFLVKISLV